MIRSCCFSAERKDLKHAPLESPYMRTSVSGHVRLYYLIMIEVLQKATKMLLVSVLIMLLLLGFFGLSHVMMPVGLDGDVAMTNCPLMFGQAALCKMNLLEHIAGWKIMFTGVVQYDGVEHALPSGNMLKKVH